MLNEYIHLISIVITLVQKEVISEEVVTDDPSCRFPGDDQRTRMHAGMENLFDVMIYINHARLLTLCLYQGYAVRPCMHAHTPGSRNICML